MHKLSDQETLLLLKRYKIPVPESGIAKNEIASARLAKELGFPVVMKISSPEIVHKTDAGGIFLNLTNESDVRQAFKLIVKNARHYNPKARIQGVLVQKMVSETGSKEVIVGALQDPQFGPVIMFGLGGIFVEVLRDISFRLIPIDRKDIREMISEIRGRKLLEGFRGQKPVSLRALENVMLKISRIIERNPEIQALDINPLFAGPEKAWAADVRIMVE